MTNAEKEFWLNISKTYGFWSRWTAFVSSFILSVKIFGLVTTILQPLAYYESDARFRRYESRIASVRRNQNYNDNEYHYRVTKEVLRVYPVELASPLVVPRLLNVNDVNSAINCKLLYRVVPNEIQGYGIGKYGVVSFGTSFIGPKSIYYGTGFYGTGSYGTVSYMRFLEAKVIYVSDGDTIQCEDAQLNTFWVRFREIDTPEFSTVQPYGDVAKSFVETAIMNRWITVVEYGIDFYGRVIGDIIYQVPNQEKYELRVLNDELIEKGLAWWYYKYSTDIKLWRSEMIARDNDVGLWADPSAIEPWVWRLTH